MTDRYDTLRPNDVIASIASMRSRWREAFRTDPDIDIEDFFAVPGRDGTTLAEHCGAAITQLNLLRNAIRTTSYPTPEPLDEQIAAAVANQGTGPWPSSALEALSALSAATKDLEAQLKLINTSGWKKAASCGSRSLTVIELAQGASRVGADRLRAVEGLVSEHTS